MDESWVSHFMPETKQQSKQWSPKVRVSPFAIPICFLNPLSHFKGSKPPRKAKRVESQKKLMYVLFFDSKGPIYQHFVPKVRTLLRSLSGTQIWASIS